VFAWDDWHLSLAPAFADDWDTSVQDWREWQLTDGAGDAQEEDLSTVGRFIQAVGDPVDIVTGDFQCDELADLSVAAPGPDLELRRYYRNRLVYNGPFGQGWAWNHSECILPMDGGGLWFYDAQQRQYQIGWENSQYVYPPGATFRITKETNGTYTLVYNDQTTLRFDANGVLTQKRDANGNTLTFGYNGSHQFVTVTDTLGRVLTLTYNAAGKVEKASAPGGLVCFYVYGTTVLDGQDGIKTQMSAEAGANLDTALMRAAGTSTAAAALPLLGAADDLVAFVDVAGNVTVYGYLQNQENAHCNHNMSQYWLPNGDYLKLGYYKNDTVAWHQNAKGEVFNFQYSFLNRYAETWNEAGYYRKVFWNDNHDVTRVTTEDQTLELMEYDANHNLTKKWDGNGNLTEFTYDAWRNVLTSTLHLAGGKEAITTYMPTYWASKPGLVKTLVVNDPEHQDAPSFPGVVLDFDPGGNLLTRTDPPVNGVQHRLRYEYDLTYEYDGQGYPTAITDGYGNVTATIDEESVDGGAWTELRRTDNTYNPDPENPNTAWPVMPSTVTDTYGAQTTFTYDGTGPADRIGRVTAITDAANQTVRMLYNAYGQVTQVTDPLGKVTLKRYDENRRLLTTTAPNGAVTANVYDVSRDIVSGAKLLQAIDPLGHSQRFTYDAVGNAVSRTDANGNTSGFQYDGMGRPIAATDALGNTVYFDYDGNGNPIRQTDARGNSTTTTYDAANRKTSVTDAKLKTTTFEYDLNGNLILTTTPDEVVTKFVYDDLNRLRKTIANYDANFADDQQPNARVSTTDYDALGRKTCETGPDGHYTRWVYDSTGALCTLTTGESDPDVRRYTFAPGVANPHDLVALRFEKVAANSYKLLAQAVTEYDARGLVWRTRDGKGYVTTFEYDELKRKKAEVAPNGTRTEYVYDEVGNLTTVRVKNSAGLRLAETRHRYNLRGERIATTQALLDATGQETGTVTQGFGYDANGNLTSTTDAEGNVSSAYYDAVNRKIAQADAEGHTTLFDYDETGNVVNVIDPLNNLASSEYDANNRLTKTTDAMGNETQFTYDDMGRVLTRTQVDPAAVGTDIITRDTYTAFGQVETVTEAEGTADEAVTTYAYTPGGRVESITDPRENTVTFEYDGAGRKTAAIDADLTREEYVYDANGNLVLTTKRDGTLVRRTYDDLNRLTLVEVNSGSGYATEQQFGYDALSRMTSASDRNGGIATHTVEFGYDSLSRLETETQDTDPAIRDTVIRAYDTRSNPVEIEYPSGRVVTRHFNTRNLPVAIDYTVGASTVTAAEYSYDAAGRMTGAEFASGVTMTRTLNANGMEVLRNFTHGSAPVASSILGNPADPVATAYDFRGNVTAQQVTLANLASPIAKSFTYDNLSRLKLEDAAPVPSYPAAVTSDRTFTYDLNGNWLSRLVVPPSGGPGTTTAYTPNADNEYTAIDATTPVYDANGNLTDLPATPDTRHFVYDWANRLVEVWDGAQLTAAYTYDALNRRVTKTVGSVTTRYVHSGAQVIEEYEGSATTPARAYVYGPGTDNPVLLDDGTATYYYLVDRQHSVLGLTTATGAIVESCTYTAFGQRQLFDSNGAPLADSTFHSPFGYTGQQFDPETGLWYYRNRMYSAELGRFLQRDPAGYVDGLNLYAYVRNNPLTLVDPSGLSPRYSGLTYQELVAGIQWSNGSDYEKQYGISPYAALYGQQPVSMGDYPLRLGGGYGADSYASLTMMFGQDAGQALGAGCEGATLAMAMALGLYPALFEEGRQFAESPSLGTVPVFGTSMARFGESLGYAIATPDFLTLSQATFDGAMAAMVWLPAAEGLSVAEGRMAAALDRMIASDLDGAFGGFRGLAPDAAGLGAWGEWGRRAGATGLERANFGNLVHYDQFNGAEGARLPTALTEIYPESNFRFTFRFEEGADVKWVSGMHPSEYPGSAWPQGYNFADFKPMSDSGFTRFVNEIRGGKLPQNSVFLPYDTVTGSLLWW